MFGNSGKKNDCPIDLDKRLWMENAFLWLTSQFGHENIATKPICVPTVEQFPIRYDGSETSMHQTAEIVARQMEVDINEVNLHLFEENIQELRGDLGHGIWTEVDSDSEEKLAAGFYFDKNEEGRYDIMIEKKNLSDPECLVATIAHEFSHIKLLGEKRLDFNDELLTDLTTVVFGLGIFNANAAFKEWKSSYSYGHNSVGYLKQREWGYALALYAFFRNDENPDWIKHVTPNLQSDFKKSIQYINLNLDKIFNEPYDKGT